MVVRRGFGWEPEFPDYRDWDWESRMGVGELREEVMWMHVQSPVRDQGRLGSCVGHAGAGAVDWLRRVDSEHWDSVYSPLDAYYYARVADGMEWEKVDCGAYVRDMAKVLRGRGILVESKWPYVERRMGQKPWKSVEGEAGRWKTGAYYRCAGVNAVCGALSGGVPVIGGFSVFSSALDRSVDRSGDIPMPQGSFEGGHAVLFVGYKKNSRRLVFKNSWGTGWGRRGYGTLPFEYLERGWADDFWAITGETETRAYNK